jgi:hypothetical protein
MKNLEFSRLDDCEMAASAFFDEIGSRRKAESSCSQASTDSDLVSSPRTFCNSYLRNLLGTNIAKKIMELRKLLVDGADSRPIEVLDDLCRLSCLNDFACQHISNYYHDSKLSPRLLQESGLEGIRTRARPALVDASVQSNINFDETGLATDFSIDPVDHDDDGIPFASTRRRSPSRCDHIPATTLSAFSWRDRPRHHATDCCTPHHVRPTRRHSSCQPSPGGPRTAPFILHQCLRIVPGAATHAGAGSGVDEVWDESFLLGVMGPRIPGPARAPPFAERPMPLPSRAAATDPKTPVRAPPPSPPFPPSRAPRLPTDVSKPRGRASTAAEAAVARTSWEWPSLIVSTVLPTGSDPVGGDPAAAAAAAGNPGCNTGGCGGRAGPECRRLLL